MSKLKFLKTITLENVGTRQTILENATQYKRIVIKCDIPSGQSSLAWYFNIGGITTTSASYVSSYALITIEIGEGIAISHTSNRPQRDNWIFMAQYDEQVAIGNISGDLTCQTTQPSSVASTLDIYVE